MGEEDRPVTGVRPVWRRLAVWRSPADQPRWARPALLALAVAAAVAYCWRLGSSTEIFYAAADRSMASSWHDFFFAAFDPAGTVSVDKLPGALWLQAVSVRLFGAHPWAVALPQAVEGALTVLVLYRAVRRGAGPGPALLAAGILAVSPATMTMDRGNVPDPLLVLLLVLAVDAAVAAFDTGRRRHLLLAALWVGLAFQAKMLEAWLVVPALLLAVLVAGDGSVLRRLGWGAALGAVALGVSLSWMAVVSLTPRADRPYVDGTADDSVVTQVFDYNGFGRVGRPSPNQVLGETLHLPVLAAAGPPASAGRLLEGAPGRDTGWLLPAAALAVPALLWVTRRRPRTDRVRTATVLWGGWLLLFAAVFSVTRINWYYLGALSPPIAALVALSAGEAWAQRRRPPAAALAALAVAGSLGYAAWLLPASGTGVVPWLRWVDVGLGVLATTAAVVVAARGSAAVAATVTRRPGAGASATWAVCAGAALLLVPLVASASVVTRDLGAFDTPFQPVAVTAFDRAFFGQPLKPIATLPTIERVRGGAPDLLAAQTSVVAAPFVFATGQEVLPIGGYDGATPEPTLGALRRDIAQGRFHLVLTAAGSTDPRARWLVAHCLAVRPTGPAPVVRLHVAYCLPVDAR